MKENKNSPAIKYLHVQNIFYKREIDIIFIISLLERTKDFFSSEI